MRFLARKKLILSDHKKSNALSTSNYLQADDTKNVNVNLLIIKGIEVINKLLCK